MLLNVSIFQNIKIVVMIGAFAMVNIGTLLLLAFVIIKAALKIATPIMRVTSVVAKVAAL
jgi:hypothetical protein